MKTICYIRTTPIFSDSRAIKTIRSLSKYYNIIVLGWDRYSENSKSQNIIIDNVRFFFYNKYHPYGSGLKGIFKMIGFSIWTKSFIKSEFNRIDLFHFCDFDSTWYLFKYIKKHKRKFFYDIYDYYPHSHFLPKIIEKVVVYLEKKIIKNSELVIVCTEDRINQLPTLPKDILVIHNSPLIIVNENPWKWDKKIYKIAFIGSLSKDRLLVEILQDASKYPQLKFIIGGSGELKDNIKNIARLSPNIEILGSLNYDDVLAIEEKVDFLFATYNPKILNHRYSAPNKLYEAMALGKPIIVCKNTGVDKIVEKYNLGAVIEYSSSDFYNKLLGLTISSDNLLTISKNLTAIYQERYSWHIMEKKLIDKYKEII